MAGLDLARPLPRPLRGRDDRRVAPFPPEEVTSRNVEAEVEARAVGLGPADVEAIWDAVVRLYRTGLEPAAALCLRHRGQVVIDRAIGHLRGNEPVARRVKGGARPRKGPPPLPVPARHDSLFNLFSASKAITAMLVHLLDDRGLLHLDDPVAEYIPDFGRHGKEWITLRHILTHRAGIPAIPGDAVDLDILAEPERILEIMCDAVPTWPPGRRLAYHALTGGFVVAEVVRQVTGRDIRTFIREEVSEPLGLPNLAYGVDPGRTGEVARHARTGPPPFWPASALLERALGVGFEQAIDLSNDERFQTGVIPAGNTICTANEACRFYQCLLDDLSRDDAARSNGAPRIFDRRTVRRAIAEQTYLEVDLTIGIPIRYGMGFMLGRPTFGFFGPDTPRAFGHMGFTNVVTWADPDRELAGCLMTSGKPFFTPPLWFWYDVLRQIAQRIPRT